MAKSFVKDPRQVVKPGDIVRVKVLEVDQPRKRISLTLRLDDDASSQPVHASVAERGAPKPRQVVSPPSKDTSSGGALADALRRAGLSSDSKKS